MSSISRFSTQSHLKARILARAPSASKTAAHLNAVQQISSAKREAQSASSPSRLMDPASCSSDCILRDYNYFSSGWDGSFLYPTQSPLNYTPLRPVPGSLPGALDRAMREVPWEGKDEIISKRLIRPEFASEPTGTPRREYQGGMMNGTRVRAVMNPYYRPTGQKRKQLDRWKSRDWNDWNPFRVAVRGGTRVYSVPDDIVPKKNELGEWREPTLSGRYQADIQRQYTMNGLPWVYKRDFLENKLHILDKEPIGPKRWYRREYRQAKIREAMRNMDNLVQEYRAEKRAGKRKTWFEQIVQKLVGGQMASKYITERKVSKI